MKVINYVFVSFFCSMLLLSCGGKEDKKKEGFSYEKKTNEPQKKKSEDISNVVISANDLMKFDKTEIKVKAGTKVRLTLRHTGKLDKKVMGHNFVLLSSGVDLVAFGTKAAAASKTEYIPEASKSDVIAHTKLIGGGETTTIEFDTPAVGQYPFLCSFPGHYAIMKGQFIVE